MLNKAFNRLNEEIKSNPDRKPTEEQKQRSKDMKLQVKALEAREVVAEKKREVALLKLGNVLHPSVPVFAKEEDGEVAVTEFGEFTSAPDVIHHHQALWMLGAYEPDKGATVAGNRGYYLRGPGVMLNQALIQYALTFLIQRKFEPVQPPYFMTKSAMSKVSQLSDFDESLYHVGEMHRGGDEKTEGDDKYLIATSEQPLCCLHMDETITASTLPIRYAGFSTCFRKEAGKFGVDTWGIFRVHQFDKVEQFVVTVPDETISYAMLEEMRTNAEEFLKSLGLPFKTINVVSGELNLAAAKKYDINAWFPSLKQHKELVSASNCTDYQSRATNTNTVFNEVRRPVHLLNATLCALTRTICCIVENHQGTKEIDGKQVRGVHVPKVLVPYMHGIDFFPFIRQEKVFDRQAAASKTEARKKSEAKQGVAPAAAAAAAGGDDVPAAGSGSGGGKASKSTSTTTTTTKTTVVVSNVSVETHGGNGGAVVVGIVDEHAGSYTIGGETFPTNVKYLVGKVFVGVSEYVAFLRDAGKV